MCPYANRSQATDNKINYFSDGLSFISKVYFQFEKVSELLQTGQVAGASAEVEVIEILKALPDDWYLLNNVCLTSSRWVRYEGEYLRTAQLDHVVVGPGGVFVIETKNWSQKFMETRDFHDPYSQVSRAAYLCHRLLKGKRLPEKVRNMIVTRTNLPNPQRKVYTKVIRPENMIGYITWFQDELNVSEVERIAALLGRYVRG